MRQPINTSITAEIAEKAKKRMIARGINSFYKYAATLIEEDCLNDRKETTQSNSARADKTARTENSGTYRQDWENDIDIK